MSFTHAHPVITMPTTFGLALAPDPSIDDLSSQFHRLKLVSPSAPPATLPPPPVYRVYDDITSTNNEQANPQIAAFFAARNAPDRETCHQIARQISGSSVVHPHLQQHRDGYDVLCLPREARDSAGRLQPALVVAFKERPPIDGEAVKLARVHHPNLVPPRWKNHGIVHFDLSPTLGVFSRPCFPLAVTAAQGLLPGGINDAGEMRCTNLAVHFARYAAQCWNNPQPRHAKHMHSQRVFAERMLARIKQSRFYMDACDTIAKLESALDLVFSAENPVVLGHGSIHESNVLIDLDTFDMTGMEGWERRCERPPTPFGIDMDWFFFLEGAFDCGKWRWRPYHARMMRAFWAEF